MGLVEDSRNDDTCRALLEFSNRGGSLTALHLAAVGQAPLPAGQAAILKAILGTSRTTRDDGGLPAGKGSDGRDSGFELPENRRQALDGFVVTWSRHPQDVGIAVVRSLEALDARVNETSMHRMGEASLIERIVKGRA